MINPDQTVLVVEDSDDDYEALVRILCSKCDPMPSLFRCENGRQALDYLLHKGAYQDPSNAVRPTLILLDINMPGIDGRGVLAEIKGERLLRSIPVIVMTTSDDQSVIEACYRIGANACVQKAFCSSEFSHAIHRAVDFWLNIAMLPRLEPIRSKINTQT